MRGPSLRPFAILLASFALFTAPVAPGQSPKGAPSAPKAAPVTAAKATPVAPAPAAQLLIAGENVGSAKVRSREDAETPAPTEEDTAPRPAAGAVLRSPTAAFELRLKDPVTLPAEVGVETESPLIFTPPLAGTFRWTTPRGGTFTPTEPPPLGQTYRVTLRDGLTRAAGQPLPPNALPESVVRTPTMEVATSCGDAYSAKNAGPLPKLELLFNAAVRPDHAAEYMAFHDVDGKQRIPVKVRLPDKEDYSPFRSGPENLPPPTWRERFTGAKPVPGTHDAYQRLVITPERPLPPGKGWRLIVAQGLPAADAPGLRLPVPAEAPVGDVVPFRVVSARAIPGFDGGRRLRVTFSKDLADAVNADTVGEFIQVRPAPANLKATAEGESTVEFRGDFALDTDYRVTVAANIPPKLPFTLAEPFAATVRFTPAQARVGFPDFATHQLAGGSRQFSLWAVNAPELRLRAKRFTPEQAVRALSVYRKDYYANVNDRQPSQVGPDGEETTPEDVLPQFDRVDFDALPGTVVHDAPFAGPVDTDHGTSYPLNWDDLLPAGRRAGIVMIEAEQPPPPAAPGAKRAGSQAIVQLTDLGLVWKTAGTFASAKGPTVFVHVFSLTDAAPADGARVRLLDASGKPLAPDIAANAEGLARLPMPAEAEKAAWLAVERGEDCHLVRFDPDGREGISLYRFHLPENWSGRGSANGRQLFVFGDRGVYRPGETVHVKLIARELRPDGTLGVPAHGSGHAVQLRAFDAKSRKFWERRVPLGPNGSLAADVPLPDVASLGRYSVQAAFSDDAATDTDGGGSESDEVDAAPMVASGSVAFQVQEFQPNAFDLKVAAQKAYPAGAERDFRLPVHAGYLFGKPLSKAKLRWTLNVNDTEFTPGGFEDYLFCTQELDYRLDRRRSDVSLQGDGALSDTGDFDVVPSLAPNAKAPAPRTGEFSAEVTDIDQQTLSQRAKFTLHSSDFYLGVRRPPEVLREGDPLPVELVAVRAADDQPVREPVQADVRLTRVDWDTVRVATAGGGSTYESKPRTTPEGETTLTTVPLRSLGTRWEPAADAPPAAPFVVGKPGTYLLEARTKDPAGREVLTATTVHVYGKAEAAWNYRSAWTMDLIPDKAEYQPGDTATVLLKTPIAGRALVTVEREGVRRTFAQRLDKASPVLRVPIEPGDSPNVFLSVVLLRGATDSPKRLKAPEYRVGYCQLAVSRPEARLNVKVAAARPDVRPGEKVEAAVEVDGHDGRPVPGAEVTLYAVDEGVLNLTGYTTPDPLGFFTRKRPLEVLTGLTLPQLHAEDAEEGNGFENKGYLVGGGGLEGARLERLRHDFPACPFWSAALVTDNAGRVTATFPAPEGLSGYRLMAVAHTTTGGFGGGESTFRVRKPFMVEPALPRFGNLGDKVLARAVLHNDTTEAGEAEIALETDERANLGDAPFLHRLPLAAGETRAVDFPVTLERTGRTAFALRGRFVPGRGEALNDAVQAAFEVNHPVPRRAETLAFKTSADRLDNLLSGASPEILAGEDGFLEVSVTNSRLGELREGVDNLLHYPYGCVEQTVSSLLPWLALKGFDGAVLPGVDRSPEQVKRAVEKSIARLGTMQTAAGGLAYWPGGNAPQPWGSAYGALGLVMAKRAGFAVSEESLTKLLDYLAGTLRDEDKAKPARRPQDAGRPLALYALALAGRPESAFHETLFKTRDKLGAEDRALLALAVLESHGPKSMSDSLLREALPVPAKPLPEDPFLAAVSGNPWADFGSPATARALRLLAACQGKPNERAVEPLLNTLLESREAGHWGTTQGDAWSLLALSAYVRNVEKANGPATTGVVTAGERRESFRLTAKGETFATTLPLGAGRGRPPLTMENPGRRPLYVHVKVSSRPSTAPTAPKDAGYALRRTYQRLGDDGALSPADDLRVGDRVLVTLELDAARRGSYLAIDDPLPAVLEAINPEFKTATAVGAGPAGGTFLPWNVSFHELRTDRALFFIDRITTPGRYQLRYVARVRAAGEVIAPAATVVEMYHPERSGLTVAGKMSAAAME